MEKVEEGVSNFRRFSMRGEEFFTRFDEREKIKAALDARRASIHYWLLGLLSAIIVAGFSAVLGWAISFEKRHHVTQAPSVSTSQNADIPSTIRR